MCEYSDRREQERRRLRQALLSHGETRRGEEEKEVERQTALLGFDQRLWSDYQVGVVAQGCSVSAIR